MCETKKTIKNFCNYCKKETNHNVLYRKIDHQGDVTSWYQNNYLIVQCAGCDTVSFRKEYSSESNTFYDGKDFIPFFEVENFPLVYKGFEKIIDENDVNKLPKVLQEIYKETCNALANGDYLLATMGTRSIIEAICKERNVCGSNLEKKIDSMKENGIISNNDARVLHSIRCLGNDAVHEVKTPNKDAVLSALKILENIMESEYVLQKDAEEYLPFPIDNYKKFKEFVFKKLENNNSLLSFSLEQLFGNNKRPVLDFNKFALQFANDVENGTIAVVVDDGNENDVLPEKRKWKRR